MTTTTANTTTEWHTIIRDRADGFTISINVFDTEEKAQTCARNAGTGEGYTVEVISREVVEDDWLIWDEIKREAQAD